MTSAELIKNAILIAHYSKLEANAITQEKIELFCKTLSNCTVIIISGGTGGWRFSVPNAYFHKTPVSYDKNDSFAKSFARFRSHLEQTGERAFHIFDPSNEPIYAFRLLCEAAKIVEEENKKRKETGADETNKAELSGITIHAPKGLPEWLAPFEGIGASDILRVSGMIGSDNVRTLAEKVFIAANGEGDLSDVIITFLNDCETKKS